MNVVDPIRVISRVRNNRLMEIRERMGMSTRQFAEWLGVAYGTYNQLENLSRYPSDQMMQRLSEKLGSAAEEAFPEYLQRISKRVSERTIPEEYVLQLGMVDRELLAASPDDFDVKELESMVSSTLLTLTPREERILRMHFGLEGEEVTLEDIARKEGLSVQRIKQIKAKSMMKLRHPSRSRRLRVAMEGGE